LTQGIKEGRVVGGEFQESMVEKLAIAEVVFGDGEFISMIWDNLG
jgi:hypothetical protein